jgi:hypothetical protein
MTDQSLTTLTDEELEWEAQQLHTRLEQVRAELEKRYDRVPIAKENEP